MDINLACCLVMAIVAFVFTIITFITVNIRIENQQKTINFLKFQIESEARLANSRINVIFEYLNDTIQTLDDYINNESK